MKKRLLAIALALCLCLALLPGAALGDEEPPYADPVPVSTVDELLNVLPSTPEPNPIPVARLTANLTLNDPGKELHSMGKLIIPDGVTLTVSGVSTDAEFEVQSGGAILVKNGGILATTQGGNIENSGAITVEKGASIVSQMGGQVVNKAGGSLTLEGTFRCGSVNYDSADHLWFENSGAVSGRGDLVVYSAGGSGAYKVDLDAMIEAAMGALGQTKRFEDWDDVNIFKEVEVSSFTELKRAFPQGGRTVAGEDVPGNMDVIAVLEENVTVTNGDVQTMGKIIVPENKRLTVAAGGDLEVGIENSGMVIVQSGGALATTQGGDIVNNGTLTVQEGASLTSQMGGSVVNAGAMTLDGVFHCGVYVTESDTEVWFRNEPGGTVTGSGAAVAYAAVPGASADLEEAIAALDGMLPDTITVTDVPAPVLPEADSFSGSKTIEITCEAVGASVYYTTDDTEPALGTLYTAPFTIDRTTTVKAVAILNGRSSTVASATYTLRSSGGAVGGGSSKTYKITVAETVNGTAAASKSTAAEGEKITVTAAPAEGYELDSITVKGEKAGSVTVTDGVFVMPADDVTVTVKFKEKKTEPKQTFTDVKPGDWFYEAVEYAAEKGLMNGVADGKFDPNGTTTRAMIVTILYRLEGEPVIRSGMPFSDVTESDWYAKAVSWAESKGIVTGYGDGRFGPNDPITREQMAAILYRYAQTKGQGFQGLWSFQLDFPDAGDVSDWATEAMSWMVMNGVINGKDGKLVPGGNASRAEAAAMLMRFASL